VTSTEQGAAVGRLGTGLATVKHPRRRFRPESEENGSVAGDEGLELALGGAIGGWVLGRVVGVLGWLGREAGEADLAGAASSSVLSGKEKNRWPCSVVTNGMDEHARGSSTSWRARAAKQLHG